jgi:mannosyltransferase
MPTAPELPSVDDSKSKSRGNSRLAFFKRPLRLKGNSSISIPLGVVLLFPCIVVVLILVLFVRHPKSGVGILMPAGAPPAIRYAGSLYGLVGISRLIYFGQKNQR